MARNCEKHFVGLNRVFLEEQWNREKERTRPPLYALKTADEVRKWIPSITKEIDYCLRQLSGARKHDYPENKLNEFEERVEKLRKEHKRFVDKVFELDPTQQGTPWKERAYVSKRKTTPQTSESNSTAKKRKPIVLNILKKEKKEKEEDD